MTTADRITSVVGEQAVVTPCGDGPLLVRHAERVVTDDGTEHPVTRPVVAVCTCHRSQRFPWCDSTHKSVRRDT